MSLVSDALKKAEREAAAREAREKGLPVPLERRQDRYAPHRQRVDAAPLYARIFHPSEPRAVAEPYERELRESGARYERRHIAGFTVLVIRR